MRHHTNLKWVHLYVERWLKAPLQRADGTLQVRSAGTPQGGVASPVLSNLFMHYAFDEWMRRTFPQVPFERYADDVVVHCASLGQAKLVLGAVHKRLTDYQSKCLDILGHYLTETLVRWAMKKYKRFRGKWGCAYLWLGRIAARDNHLFFHWSLGLKPTVGR